MSLYLHLMNVMYSPFTNTKKAGLWETKDKYS